MGFRRLSFPTDLFFCFQIISACLPCRSRIRGGKSLLGWPDGSPKTQPSQWWHRRHPSDWSWLPGKPTGGVYVAEARISPSVMAPTSSSVLAFLHSSSRPKRHAQWPYVPARPLSGPLTVTVPTRVSRYRKQK
nr:mel-13a protein - mouse [Mus musculus]